MTENLSLNRLNHFVNPALRELFDRGQCRVNSADLFKCRQTHAAWKFGYLPKMILMPIDWPVNYGSEAGRWLEVKGGEHDFGDSVNWREDDAFF